MTGFGMDGLENLVRPALRSSGEPDLREREERSLAAHPEASVMRGSGFCQAHLRLPKGSDTITRWTMGELMDELESRYG